MDPDLVIVGAGAMGGWTALRAIERGHRVVLVDAFGPGDPRATSSDQTRILRASHGADAFYPGWAMAARTDWIELGNELGEPIFEATGVAWFAHRADGFEAVSEATLRTLGIPVERMTTTEAATRWPAIATDDLAFVLYEPECGALRARAGVLAVAEAFRRRGGDIRVERVMPGRAAGRRLEAIITEAGDRIGGETFVFATGPWLPRLFPDLLDHLISVTRQEVFYLGRPAAEGPAHSTAMPTWIDFDRAIYGIPSIAGGGAKVASDAYGPAFDPDTGDRRADERGLIALRAYLAERMPALAGGPLVDARVCQYEATPDTHFVIDRHPAFDNVWIVGGGSGHGFKHAPQIGRHVVGLIEGSGPADGNAPPDDRFSLLRPRRAQPGMRSGADTPRPAGSGKPI